MGTKVHFEETGRNLMKKRLFGFLLFAVIVTLLGACGDSDKKDSTEDEKLITAQAEKLVKEKLISTYQEMGLAIDEYEISDIKLAEQVPYSKGGTFDFYGIQVRLKLKNQEQAKAIEKRDQIKFTYDKEGWLVKNSNIGSLYISAYNDGKQLYEFSWIREKDLPKTEKGDLDFKAFIEYRYEQLNPVATEDEYTLKINNKMISIGDNDRGGFPMKEAQATKEASGDFMQGFTNYRKIWRAEGFCAETYCYFEKHYEPILRMATTDTEAVTFRGIRVGATEDELFKAYGADNLRFSSKAFGGEWFGSFAEEQKLLEKGDEWTCFGFSAHDDTLNYIAFYMEQGRVAAIEMGTGFDYKPFEKEAAAYPLEVESFIDDHIDETNVMKYDVIIPKVKSSVNGSDNLNALIQSDFDKIIEYSQKKQYEPPMESGFTYPWVNINYSISNLGKVAVLNIFTDYSSALGSGSERAVHSYYYDTTCGARLSEEAAIYRLGYAEEQIENYFKAQYPDKVKYLSSQEDLFNNITFYFSETGEPKFILNGYV